MSSTRILVGTVDGLHEIATDGRLESVHHQARSVVALAGSNSGLWALLDGAEVWRAAGGDGWALVARLGDLRGHCLAITRAGTLVGTSQARLLRVTESGFEDLTAFERAPGRDSWYTPWGDPPDTRSIAEDGDAVYVNVHVGGIPRSRDLGDSWLPTIDVDADVHEVWTGPGRLFAACARGLAVSEDGGDTWSMRTDGLHATYCRAGAICGETVLVSASTGPSGGHSAVYRGRADGGRLEHSRRGVPEWFDQNIDSHCIDALPDGSLAVFATADGRVFVSDDEGASWAELASSIPHVRCLLLTT